MKVESITTQKPDIQVTMTWEEATILREIWGRLKGYDDRNTDSAKSGVGYKFYQVLGDAMEK